MGNLSMSQLKSKNHIQTKIKEYCTYIQTLTGIDCGRAVDWVVVITSGVHKFIVISITVRLGVIS